MFVSNLEKNQRCLTTMKTQPIYNTILALSIHCYPNLVNVDLILPMEFVWYCMLIYYAILQCVTFLERKKRSSWYQSLAIFIYKKYLAIKFDALFCGNPFYLRFSVLLFFYVGFLHWCLINSQINTALQMTSLYKLICQVLVYHSFHKSFVSELIRNGDLPISY